MKDNYHRKQNGIGYKKSFLSDHDNQSENDSNPINDSNYSASASSNEPEAVEQQRHFSTMDKVKYSKRDKRNLKSGNINDNYHVGAKSRRSTS